MPDQMFVDPNAPAWKPQAPDAVHEVLSNLPEVGQQQQDLPAGLGARIHAAPFPGGITDGVQYAERGYDLDEALEGLYD